jgi:hypothetical protein
MPISTLVAALLSLGSPDVGEKSNICMVHLPPVGGKTIASYVLITDKKFRPLEKSLHLRTGEFTVHWDLKQGLRGRESMRWFDAWVPMAHATPFPVEMKLVADEREISTMKAWPSQDKEEAGLAWFMSTSVPNIFGIRSLSGRLTDRNGQGLAGSIFKLPDWRWLERESTLAGRSAENLRLKRRCHLLLMI